MARTRWLDLVTRELRRAGPTKADKRAAFQRAKAIYHGHGGMRENPSGNKLLKIGLIAGGAYFGLKWLQSRAAPAPEAKTAA